MPSDGSADPCSCCSSGAPGPTRDSPFSAWVINLACTAAHHALLPRKRQLFGQLRRERGVATVAEVGLGSGPNLELYGREVESIVGIDINAASQPYAQKAAEAAGLAPGRLKLVVGRAEALPLPDASVDAVVATHLLCSVDDPAACVREFQRVLKPGGLYVFTEHVAAAPGTWLSTLQRWASALTKRAFHCSVSHDALGTIRGVGGWAEVEAESFAIPAAALVWSPHAAGTAVKGGKQE